jgi:hypothetical protein
MEKPSEVEFCPDQEQSFLALMKLMPPGRAWDNEEIIGTRQTIIRKFIGALALSWSRFEAAMCQSLDDWFCYASVWDLDLWSIDYGVPDECDLYNASLCAKVEATHSTGAASIAALLEASGYSVEARWLTGNDPEFPDVRSTLRIMLDPYLSTAYTERTQLPFSLGTGRKFGSPTDITALQCMLERYIPAHTVILTGVAGDFDPFDLGAKLMVWFAAEDLSLGNVSSWTSRVGSMTVNVLNAGAFPQAQDDLVGAYRFVNANGVDQALRSANADALTLGNGTVVALMRQNALPADATDRYLISTGKGAVYRDVLRTVSGVGADAMNHLKVMTERGTLAGTTKDLSGTCSIEAIVGSDDNLYGRVNGEATVPPFAALGAAGAGPPASRITMFASNAATATGYFNGGLRHLFYTSELTHSEYMKLEAWVAWDMNQQTTLLPPDHPYRNLRP